MNVRPEDWSRVKGLFHAALEIEPAARSAYLAEACADQPDLRAQVEALLASHDRAGAMLETPAAAVLDVAGEATNLAGRRIGPYQVGALIGRGGMGEVYQAHDTKLDRPVALKLLPAALSADPERLRRFHTEARTASALNHPHILVVHDFGEIDGGPFIVTELVEGETLRVRLRGGPLPVRDALEIAIQIAAALAAAHARGLVHRDVKPENVMLRPDGYVKVLDFGLAKLLPDAEASPARETTALTHPGVVLGTPRYMSPEQIRAVAVDARADVWSLGVTLYEMLAGRAPFEGATTSDVLAAVLREPVSLASSTADVPPAVAAIVDRAMAKDPAGRFASAADMQKALIAARRALDDNPAVDRSIQRRAARWILASATAAALAIGAAAWRVGSRPHAPALTERDAILLADVENRTGDPVFDDTLKTALAVALEQSPRLRLVPEERVRATLALTGRPKESAITVEAAADICQRDGVKAFVGGSITPLGSQFVLSLNARACVTGESLGREQEEAARKEEVLGALGRAAARLRARLGESLASIRRFDTPLDRATTSSLEALQAYSAGLAMRRRLGFDGDREIVPFFKRAIDLDPDFALAYVALGRIYGNIRVRNRPLAIQYMTEAFKRRDRVSDMERLAITTGFYETITEELDKAMEAARVWMQQFPNDSRPAGNVATFAYRLGFKEQALEAQLEAVRRDPDDAAMTQNLVDTYLSLNLVPEAHDLLERAVEAGHFQRGQRRLYEVAFVRNDASGMERERAAARGHPAAERLLKLTDAQIVKFHGRYRAGRALQRADGQLTALNRAEIALQEALVGNAADARQWIDDAVAAGSLPDTDRESAYLVMVANAADPVQARKMIDDAVAAMPLSTMVNRIQAPTARAVLALRRGEAARAIEELKGVLPHDRAQFVAPYVRGYAYLKLGDGSTAANEFQKLLANRGALRVNVLFPLAYLGLARAEATAGRVAQSRGAFERFVELWKDADPDLPVLIEARREFGAAGH